MAIALIASDTGATGGANSDTTSGVDTTGANLMVLFLAWYVGGSNSTPPTFTDSKGNTWTGLTSRWNITIGIRIYYCVNPSVGSGHTVTASKTGAYPTPNLLAYSGVDTTSPLFGESGYSAGGLTSIQPGSLTPDVDNCLLATGTCTFGSTPTLGAGGFTSRINGPGPFQACADLIQGTAAAANPTWNGPGVDMAAAMAAFRPSSGGGGGPPATFLGAYAAGW